MKKIRNQFYLPDLLWVKIGFDFFFFLVCYSSVFFFGIRFNLFVGFCVREIAHIILNLSLVLVFDWFKMGSLSYFLFSIFFNEGEKKNAQPRRERKFCVFNVNVCVCVFVSRRSSVLRRVWIKATFLLLQNSKMVLELGEQ